MCNDLDFIKFKNAMHNAQKLTFSKSVTRRRLSAIEVQSYNAKYRIIATSNKSINGNTHSL